MLSTVLRSEKAIQINIDIMRAFARYRSLIKETESLRKEIQAIDQKLDKAFKFLLNKLNSIHEQESKPSRKIGFRIKNEDR